MFNDQETLTPASLTESVESAPVAQSAFNLSLAVAAKIEKENLSVAAAAKAIGISPLALAGTLKGASKPNSRTASKFAAWLGVDVALIASGAKSPKTPGAKAGRPAGRPAKVATEAKGKASTSGDYTTAQILAIVKAGLIAGKAASKAAKPNKADLALAGDKLAVAVHKAGKKARLMVELVLDQF